MLWLFLVTFLLFIIIGIPIVFSLLLANIILISVFNLPFEILVKKILTGIDSFPLLAIPFYMFVGQLMNKSGIAKRLINFANSLVGFIPGDLGHVNILASLFFGGISGSAVADTSAVGGILIPAMSKQNYPVALSTAITSSSSIIGIIIPPSIPFILYGICTGTSISALFLGGIIPGIIVGLALMTTTYFICRKHSYGVYYEQILKHGSAPRFNLSQVWKTFKEAWISLTIPLIIVGGILGGVFTPTEAGAVAAVVCIIISLFIYKEIKLKDLPKMLLSTGKTTGIVLFLCGVATVTAWILTVGRVPFQLTALFTSVTSSKVGVLLMLNVLLFLVGCVLDLTPAILILAPILLPVVKAYGIDPIYFGVIMSVNLGIGLITPPVGTILYVACSVANIKLEALLKSILPFFVTLIIVLLLLIMFPQVILFLPNLFL
jgi:tripartite ATP-independent transporter DctM subunit